MTDLEPSSPGPGDEAEFGDEFGESGNDAFEGPGAVEDAECRGPQPVAIRGR